MKIRDICACHIRIFPAPVEQVQVDVSTQNSSVAHQVSLIQLLQ